VWKKFGKDIGEYGLELYQGSFVFLSIFYPNNYMIPWKSHRLLTSWTTEIVLTDNRARIEIYSAPKKMPGSNFLSIIDFKHL